jgi:hypothetical protein
MILQGPHFHVANPIYKTPRRICNSKGAYDVVDLSIIDKDYLPRTNYKPAVSLDEYRRRVTKCRWDTSKSHGSFFRLAFRRMIGLNGERSLISAIISPNILHVNVVESIAFQNSRDLLNLAGLCTSIIFDIFVKASGIQDIRKSVLARFPYAHLPEIALQRVLFLNCITSNYDPLLHEFHHLEICQDWTLFDYLSSNRDNGKDLHRRAAMIELDILSARAFGLSLEQVIDLYRIYFPIVQENDDGTWYDQNGRIVWTCSKGLSGVGYLNEKGKSPGRKEWESILESDHSELVCAAIDDTTSDGPKTVERRFVGPFFKCDRMEDYKRAWAHFEKLEQEGKL